MHHDRSPHTRSHVGGTRGEVTVPLTVREVQHIVEGVVDAATKLPGLDRREPGKKGLDAEMIFLVDHDADGFIAPEHDSLMLDVLRVGGADQVLFDQELALQRRDLRQG